MGVTVVASGGSLNVSLSSGSIAVETKTNVVATSLSTWSDLVNAIGRGYNFPMPTGQTTVYRTGDDADIEATIFTASVRAANSLKAQNSLASFLVLNNTNSFGNTIRFTDELGTEVFAAGYVVDNYTGLGWSQSLQSTAVWDDGIDNSLSETTLGGFSDWFMPDIIKLMSILITTIGTSNDNLNYSPFNTTFVEIYSSSTRASLATQALTMTTIYRSSIDTKTTSRQFMICRKHF